jgi:hypothetical protein
MPEQELLTEAGKDFVKIAARGPLRFLRRLIAVMVDNEETDEAIGSLLRNFAETTTDAQLIPSQMAAIWISLEGLPAQAYLKTAVVSIAEEDKAAEIARVTAENDTTALM